MWGCRKSRLPRYVVTGELMVQERDCDSKRIRGTHGMCLAGIMKQVVQTCSLVRIWGHAEAALNLTGSWGKPPAQ